MPSSFNYTTPVTGRQYLGRRSDSVKLSNLLSQGEHIVMYEPPKSGKHSLILQGFAELKMTFPYHIVAELSLLPVRRLEDFLGLYASTVIKSFCSTPADYARCVATYFQGSHIIHDPEAYSSKGEIVSMNWNPDDNDIRAVLELPFRMAADSTEHLFLVLNEFQNIMQLENGEYLCRTLEDVMKEFSDRKCGILFVGSRVNAMKEIFETKGFFYRLVNRVQLTPLQEKDIVEHFARVFLTSGKELGRDLMLGVCALFLNNLWYITHLCAISDSLSKGYIMEPILQEALNIMISIHEPRFKSIMDDLTTFQVSLLRAILEGNSRFSSAEVIRHYGLNSSANVRRLKDALMKKEIVVFDEKDEPTVIDPLFEYWAKTYFFKIQ